jgi:hypothetical protein
MELIPRPYVNLIVYHGVLAPNAKWRREVVDFGRSQVENAPSASTPQKVGASTCSNAPIAVSASDLSPPSCSRAPSAESPGTRASKVVYLDYAPGGID